MENVDLKTALPPYMSQLYETRAVLDSLSKEMELLYEKGDETFKNLTVKGAVSRIELWEREFSIEDPSGSFDERKRAVLARMGLLKTQTVETVKAFAESILKGAKVEIEEKDCTVYLTVTDDDIISDFLSVKTTLKKALPAHVALSSRLFSNFEAVSLPRTYSYIEMDMDFEIQEESI